MFGNLPYPVAKQMCSGHNACENRRADFKADRGGSLPRICCVVYRSMLLVIDTVAQFRSGPYRYQHTGRITVRMMGKKGRIPVKLCTLLSTKTSPKPAIQPPARLWRIAKPAWYTQEPFSQSSGVPDHRAVEASACFSDDPARHTWLQRLSDVRGSV
jgi:hypothetical protein